MATVNLAFVSLDVLLDVSYEGSHVIRGLLCPASFTQHKVFVFRRGGEGGRGSNYGVFLCFLKDLFCPCSLT